MEVELSTLFLTLLFLLLLLKLGNRFRTKNSISHLPPGPRRLPLIGNIHQLFGSQIHLVFRELANKHGPLMHLQLGEVSTIVVSSPEMAKEVMKTHDIIFASRPHIIATKIMSYDSTSITFSPYGEYWRQLRKICTLELLSTRRVQSFQYIREEETSNLMSWIACNAGLPINLTEKLYSTAATIILGAAFGKKSKEQEALTNVSKEATNLATGFNIADIYPSVKLLHSIGGVKQKLESLHKTADRVLDKIINDHKIASTTNTDEAEAHKDLVDVLLKCQEDANLEFSLTIDNIKAVLWDIFGAGSETSATTLDWAMAEIIKNPRILKKAQEEVREIFSRKGYVDEDSLDELKYLKSIIKEALRLHPPVPLLLPRHNTERCEINEFEIPLKTKVIVNAWAINRDPRYWQDAECFKPERFLDKSIDYKGTYFEYIPFGAGRRICPGIQFGMANIELPLAKLLYYFDWNLPSGMKLEDLDMTEAFGLTLRRKYNLYLVPILRNPLPGFNP